MSRWSIARCCVGVLFVIASCGDSEATVPKTSFVGRSQQELASWSTQAASSIREQTSIEQRCAVMAEVRGGFFERVVATTLDASANPAGAWGAASQLSLVINEADTFCTWTEPDPDLVGGAAMSMASLLSELAGKLVTSP